MKFGMAFPCITPIATPPWPDDKVVDGIEAVAKKADSLGYDYVSCCDHPVIPKESAPYMGARWFDALATLGFAAGMTSRIKLMVSVIVLPYRSPFDMAKAYGTLDSLSNGRVIFGVGVGHLQKEFEALGANYKERGPVSDELIEAVKALWSNDVASFHGKYWDFHEMMVSPRPVSQPHPPIWVGGNAKAAVRRAVLHGDGWHPMQMSMEDYRRSMAYARQLIQETGRTSPMSFSGRLDAVSPAAVTGGKTAQPIATRQASAGSSYSEQASQAPYSAQALTTAEDVLQRIEAYRAEGATHINVGFRYQELPELLESMEWFAREVMGKYQ